MSMTARLLSFFAVLLTVVTSRADNSGTIMIGRFTAQDLSGWEKKQFVNETDYSFTNDHGHWVLLAQSSGSASGLVKKQKIDLNDTPYLKWSWQVLTTPTVTDEKTKVGDDYSARLYVIFSTGPWFWNTYALNYVWNSSYPIGSIWSNAFTTHARMLALRSKADGTGVWYTEKRNVKTDIEQVFGSKIDTIEAVAIMTDSDNSQSEAVAAYGDITFSRNEQP